MWLLLLSSQTLRVVLGHSAGRAEWHWVLLFVPKEFLLKFSLCSPLCCHQVRKEGSWLNPPCEGISITCAELLSWLGPWLHSAACGLGGWVCMSGMMGKARDCLPHKKTNLGKYWAEKGRGDQKIYGEVHWFLASSPPVLHSCPDCSYDKTSPRAFFLFSLAWMWMSFLLQVQRFRTHTRKFFWCEEVQ